MSDREIKDLYRKSKMTQLVSRDEQEVAGYFNQLEMIFENHDSMPLSENIIL